MTDYAERNRAEIVSLIVRAGTGNHPTAIGEDRQERTDCYRCGRTDAEFAGRRLCRQCSLAIDAVLRPLTDDERQERRSR